MVPTIWNDVFAWGIVTDQAFDRLLGRLLEGIELADRVDGVLLQLHGAMVTERHDGVEGYLLERVRRSVGKDVPIIATLDLHANISKQAVNEADILRPAEVDLGSLSMLDREIGVVSMSTHAE